MSEEEKQAIADLKEQIKQDVEELPYSEESLQYKQTILNLINKLQKENVELKEKVTRASKRQLIVTTNYWKDKIRDKIKELEKQYKEELRYGRVVLDIGHTIKILKELLGE